MNRVAAKGRRLCRAANDQVPIIAVDFQDICCADPCAMSWLPPLNAYVSPLASQITSLQHPSLEVSVATCTSEQMGHSPIYAPGVCGPGTFPFLPWLCCSWSASADQAGTEPDVRREHTCEALYAGTAIAHFTHAARPQLSLRHVPFWKANSALRYSSPLS